jgi:hypothetical protein
MWQRCYRLTVLILAVAVFTACAHTTSHAVIRIDGSIPESFQASWARLHHSLSRQQQSQLDLAILPIALGKYKSLTEVPPSLLSKGIGPQSIRVEIDGLSFQEIIDLANRQPIKLSLPHHPSTTYLFGPSCERKSQAAL